MDLSGLLQTTIESQYSKQEVRPYIGASSIGNSCARSIWYSFHGAPRKIDGARTLINFEIGRRLESVFMDWLSHSDAGLIITRPSEENGYLACRDEDIDLFQGHMDAQIEFPTGEKYVLEFKTAKNSSWNNFKKNGLKKWSNNYYCQLQSYMGMSGLKNGVLLAINKDTSELHHEYVMFDANLYRILRDKAYAISSAAEAPERINKNSSFLACSMCSYKDICHVKEKIGC